MHKYKKKSLSRNICYIFARYNIICLYFVLMMLTSNFLCWLGVNLKKKEILNNDLIFYYLNKRKIMRNTSVRT